MREPSEDEAEDEHDSRTETLSLSEQVDDRGRRRALAMLSVVIMFAVSAGTMVNVALPTIGDAFDVTEGTYGWIVTGFTLTFAVFSSVHGRLAERVGVRRLYLAGVLVFGLGSALVGVLQSIGWIIAVRIIQGAGAAAVPALGSLIVARLYPPERRGGAMGILLASVGLAASIGPFLGGALIQVFHWRMVFWMPALMLVAIPLGLRWLPAQLDDDRSRKPLDLGGALLLIAGVSLLMYGFNLVHTHGVGLLLGGALALGVLTLVGFGLWIRARAHPFVPPAVLADRRYLAAVTIAFLSQATRMGTVVLVPILLHEVEHLEPIWVGLVLLPGAILVTVMSPFSGRLSDRVGARAPVTGGSLCMVVGNLVMAACAGFSVAGVTVGMALYGLGFAFIQSPLLSVSSQYVPARHTGMGVGLFMMIFFLGGAFGIALSTTTIELQAASAPSWIGLPLGAGAIYSNAALTLTGLALVGLALARTLPARAGARAPRRDPTESGMHEAPPWSTLLRRPADAQREADVDAWLVRLAELLLHDVALQIGDARLRIVELEVYYDDPARHPDPFTHGDPRQRSSGRWYLHRSGAGLRGGSFKGIDITIGDGDVPGGVLVRGLERVQPGGGALIDGPSLCVDHMIAATSSRDIAELDRAVDGQPVWREGLALQLVAAGDLPRRPIYRSGRVGLTLKRVAEHPGMVATVLRPYRFLTTPRATKKGKLYTALALHAQGLGEDEIQRVTGTPAATLKRHVSGFEAGRRAHADDASLAAFHGARLTPALLAQLHGAWHRHYGA